MDYENFIQQADEIENTKGNLLKEQRAEQEHKKEIKNIVGSIKDVGSEIKNEIKKKKTVSVDNFPESVKTPDVERVVLEVKSLKDVIKGVDTTDPESRKLLKDLISAINKIPTPKFPDFPKEIKVSNPTDITKQTDKLSKDIKSVETAVKKLKLDVKPQINVKPAEVKIDTDAIISQLESVREAIASFSVVIPETDNEPVISALNSVEKSIADLVFPAPNYILPFKTSGGTATQALVDDEGRIKIDIPEKENPSYVDSIIVNDGVITCTTTKTFNGKSYQKVETFDTSDPNNMTGSETVWSEV